MATTMNAAAARVRRATVRDLRRRRGAAAAPRRSGGLARCSPRLSSLRVLLIALEVRPGGIPASAAGSSPASASQPAVLPAGVADRFYVVEAGDTLWSIARRSRPHRDVRGYVDEL